MCFGERDEGEKRPKKALCEGEWTDFETGLNWTCCTYDWLVLVLVDLGEPDTLSQIGLT